MTSLGVDPDLEALQSRVRAFVAEVVIPAEKEDRSTHGLADDLRTALQREAKGAGLFAPLASSALGGMGLNWRSAAVVLEEAGYSLLGPPAMNCAAPDEGNMHLLAAIANPSQRERYLAPLARGAIRSCFAMTEPSPGAGSDPSMLTTRAERVTGGWSISGRKWFITGAKGAAFAICMAQTERGATMFVVDADNPGWTVDRLLEVTDRAFSGGHAEVTFESCEVPDEAVLGTVGEGFRYAQVRLAPGRLTHCMRWLGAARRALDIAMDYARERETLGRPLAGHGMVQERIARSVIDLEASRLLILRGALDLDRGEDGRRSSSIAKVFVAEAVCRVVDRATQICGGVGVSGETILGRLAGEVRPFRIYDGPTEAHLAALARRELAGRESAVARD